MKILVIGGTRYFGKRAVGSFLKEGAKVTLLTRGQRSDDFGNAVERLHVDRSDEAALKHAIGDRKWDLVLDQFCMNAAHSQAACRIFKGKIGHYVATSSKSVYPSWRADITEADFDPRAHAFTEQQRLDADYGEAKRQMEAVFAREAPFPIALLRFPIVLGPDDYTLRLHWHMQRVRDARPMHLPAPQARMGFISSQDAAACLLWACKNPGLGPVNLGSPDPIGLDQLLGMIQANVGGKPVLSAQGDPSPFGVEGDSFMDVSKAQSLGAPLSLLGDWLPGLVRSEAKNLPPL